MSRKLEEIAAEALELSSESRAALARWLLESLDEIEPKEHERLWVEEAARRYEDLRAGKINATVSDELFADLESRIRR